MDVNIDDECRMMKSIVDDNNPRNMMMSKVKDDDQKYKCVTRTELLK